MLKRLVPEWLLSPVNIIMEFSDRPYTLGESINLAIELRARRDLQLAEGRLDLVCEERYAETYTRSAEPPPTAGLITKGDKAIPLDKVSKQVVKEFVESYVHSGAVFLEDESLAGGTSKRYEVGLNVQSEIPPHASGGTLAWTLVALVTTDRGRKITETRQVAVTVAS